MDVVGKIMALESGEMEASEVVDFVAELIKSGLAWSLQGSYGRMASGMINAGYVSAQGVVLKYPEEA